MKLRMAFVAVLVLCVSVPAHSQGFFYLTGVISGVPVVSASGWNDLRLRADETSGANLGNEIGPIANGPYQMALFPGTYDLRLKGYLRDYINGQSIYFGVSTYEGYPFIEDVVISGDTTQNIALPIYELTGVVTDTDGNPIPGVKLEYSQVPVYGSTTTSSEPSPVGTYKLFFVPGTYNLTISPPADSRFSTTQRSVTISGNQDLTITLEAQNLLTGVISGVPVVSASGWNDLRLRADETSGANLGNEIGPIANGPYQMALFPGTYDLRLKGYLRDYINGQSIYFGVSTYEGYPFIEDVVISGDTTQNIALPIYELTGVVTDTDGNPIPDVKLEYSQVPVYGSTISSSEPSPVGAYKLFFVPGTYNLTISPPAGSRFSTTQRSVTISGNQNLTITLEAQNLLSGTISGMPVISGSGWNDLRLRASETSGANLGNEIGPIANGPYQMALFPGTYDLRLKGYLRDYINGQSIYFGVSTYEGYPFIEDVVISGDTTQNIALPIYELTGVVTDTDGNPIPDVKLEYSQVPVYGSTISSSEPSPVGAYKLFFVPGTYNLIVSAPPDLYPPFEIKKLHITGNAVRDIVLSWDYTVLEEAIAAITPSLELHFDQFDVIDQGQVKVYEVPVTAPRDQMELIVNWEGSEVLAQVFRPDDSLYDEFQSETPPIVFQIASPELGIWKVKVKAIEVPYNNYPIAVVAGITPNAIPAADANGPYAGSVGEALTFDARGSDDTNGQIVRYEWDWNNDGTYDLSSTLDMVAHTWTAPYDGWVSLRVTDNEGAQGYDSAYVKITHNVDLASFAASFGRSDCAAGDCAGDFTADGDVDGKDLAAFLSGM